MAEFNQWRVEMRDEMRAAWQVSEIVLLRFMTREYKWEYISTSRQAMVMH